jgi:hypothetical protein
MLPVASLVGRRKGRNVRSISMTDARNTIIAILAVATAVLGYFYYQRSQNVVEIKLPSVTVEKQ